MKRHRFLKFFWIAPLVLLFTVVFGFVVMWLWNWLMPSLFGLHRLSYWQAWGILVLCKILFGGFRGGRGGGDWNWQKRMRERWEKMTTEEREKFRHGLESCWGTAGPSAAQQK